MSFVMFVSTIMLMGRLFPDTPFGQWCRETVTAPIVAALGKVRRRHIILFVIGLVAIQAFALAMPFDMAFVAIIDTATYVDVLLAVGTVAVLNRSVLLWASLRAGMAGMAARLRRSRDDAGRAPDAPDRSRFAIRSHLPYRRRR